MNSIFQKLREIDAYPKINEDFYKRSFSGGVITLISSLVMALLFFSELRSYLHIVTETKLVVDTSRGGNFTINFDVTFPAVPCTLLSLDAEDISGERHLDIKHDIVKKRIDAHGNVIQARQDSIGAPKVVGLIITGSLRCIKSISQQTNDTNPGCGCENNRIIDVHQFSIPVQYPLKSTAPTEAL
ncbi:hypothetical protein Cgig2_014795 [Carnegiea gigantea]|uniref:Endoplasmic reticulum vesicle transporter N-terminal domain-containing protein n=1 Tax=Carnegiea gigantea TaxID=171969 RepID=A0A9Q1L2S0_9CARY|nr:hypothetical protein Cgig2_014795 [Carnegiea gigantea]